jgi:protein-S-isoprenylcysteine O-methyltransferase Ste14
VVFRVARSATIRPVAVADWIGLVLFLGGISLRLWSFHALGRYFTFTIQTSGDQPVIADGPYRVIGHPSYAGLLLIIMGVGLFTDAAQTPTRWPSELTRIQRRTGGVALNEVTRNLTVGAPTPAEVATTEELVLPIEMAGGPHAMVLVAST